MTRRRAVDPRTGRLYRVVEKPARLGAPPPALRRARLDNLALIPGSLLPFKKEWQALANQLPEGSTLIILPSSHGSARQTLEKVSRSMKAKGQRVTTLSQDQLPLEPFRRQPTRKARRSGPLLSSACGMQVGFVR